MEVIHYTKEPFELDKDRAYNLEYEERYMSRPFWKPHGLWVSIEDKDADFYDWYDWSMAEEFRTDHLSHANVLKISDHNDGILQLQTLDDVYEFNQEFAFLSFELTIDRADRSLVSEWLRMEQPGRKEPWFYDELGPKDSIRWKDVMNKWQGIFIYPYHWQIRHHEHFRWYNTWDCSSGCIWDLDVIEGIEQVRINYDLEERDRS